MCLLMFRIGLCLGTETISASFQDKGNRPSRKEVFMISINGWAPKDPHSPLGASRGYRPVLVPSLD